uniref:uncharacterized protein F13E9.13, mitochondrial isoform X3 n=1 Tax=Monopterus albus TaxID=43700 RepID=UPI0009B36E32|nr:uncharacterized protein F13E9.13, mitochondrial-like isoform X3 [Monopterus albus]
MASLSDVNKAAEFWVKRKIQLTKNTILRGTPLGCMKMSHIIKEACREASIYRDEGIDGLIIENMHDVPYSSSVGPEVCACMTVVCAAVRGICPFLPLGVQILSSANQQALAVALASGLDFIRAEGFVFSHVADEGLLNACAGDLLRYRKQIGADRVQIFTDIKKKHRRERPNPLPNTAQNKDPPVDVAHRIMTCSTTEPTAFTLTLDHIEDLCVEMAKSQKQTEEMAISDKFGLE